VAKIKTETFTVTKTGVGRRDYSQEVQFSTEPIVRSYQNSYVHDEVYTLAAGQTRTIDVAIVGNTVVLLYDFLLSAPINGLLTFEVQAIDQAGVVASIFRKSDYQKVAHHHSRGAPVFRTIRLILTNHCDVDIANAQVTINGIYTSDTEYHMRYPV